MDTPTTGGEGILWNGAFIPTSPPLSYVPCRGEAGIRAGKVFLPIEPLSSTVKANTAPTITTATYIDNACPWIDQVDMRVATPCLKPYNWSAATANRTMVLDTVPDADATTEEKALPGYVANPGIEVASRTHREYDLTKYDDANGVGYLWTYGNSPATPHPALRAGQTRYGGISGNAVGTPYNGTPFIPGTAGAIINGTLKISAYRYGLLLSDVGSYDIKVKIGRGTATWSAGGATLTLATDTTGATIKYSVDGSAPTLTYSTPLSIASTTTVRWYVTKTSMVDSDEWQTVITYAGATPPADFATVYFSSLPAFVNSPVQTDVQFQRKPDYYISPSGTGDGLLPSTPGNMTSIIGTASMAGTAANGTLVWACEGTYTNPTGNQANYFKNANMVTIRGGYSTDYTERDAVGRKSILTNSVWYDGGYSLYLTNNYLINLATNAAIDGFWFDAIAANNLDTVNEDNTYRFPTWLEGTSALVHNCRADVAQSLSGGASVVSHASYNCGTSNFYNCDFSVDLSLGNDTGSISTIDADKGISVFIGGLAHNCILNFKTDSGNSCGSSYGSGHASASGSGVNFDTVNSRCTIIGYAKSGNGGAQTAGGATTGGHSTATASVGRSSIECTISLESLSGIGGSAVTGGTSTAVSQVSGGYPMSQTSATLTATSGNGGTGSSINGNSIADVKFYAGGTGSAQALGVKNTVTGNATSGTGASSIATVDCPPGYKTHLSGASSAGASADQRAYLIAVPNPCYFVAGDITFTEGAPYGAGNPVRVDHAAGSTTGWYSGLDAGQGAPLSGYETPAGGSVQLGDFWE